MNVSSEEIVSIKLAGNGSVDPRFDNSVSGSRRRVDGFIPRVGAAVLKKGAVSKHDTPSPTHMATLGDQWPQTAKGDGDEMCKRFLCSSDWVSTDIPGLPLNVVESSLIPCVAGAGTEPVCWWERHLSRETPAVSVSSWVKNGRKKNTFIVCIAPILIPSCADVHEHVACKIFHF